MKERKIVNRRLRPRITDESISFRADNTWEAEDVVLIRERLDAAVSDREGVRVLDLTYHLTPLNDLTLSRWAFSGFCLRVRKDGDIPMHSPASPANFPVTFWIDCPTRQQRLSSSSGLWPEFRRCRDRNS